MASAASIIGPFIVWLAIGEVPAVETFLGGALILAALAIYFTIALRAGPAEPSGTTIIPHT